MNKSDSDEYSNFWGMDDKQAYRCAYCNLYLKGECFDKQYNSPFRRKYTRKETCKLCQPYQEMTNEERLEHDMAIYRQKNDK